MNAGERILTVQLATEHDIVHARQRARQLAEQLGFGALEQTQIATAVSEIARNAWDYGHGGTALFEVGGAMLRITITDRGPGIARLDDVLDGVYVSPHGMGRGILGSRRLVDEFDIASTPGAGTTVRLGKRLPGGRDLPLEARGKLSEDLVKRPLEGGSAETRRQNAELLAALDRVEQLNRELEETNRGVVALYAELEEKAASLQRANEEKSRFLSYVSHEFRTPLNAILSLSRLLLDEHASGVRPEGARQLNYLRRAAADLGEMVNDLLDLGRVDAGKVKLRITEFDVPSLFGSLRGMFRPLLPEDGAVDLVFETIGGLPYELPSLTTDEGKLAQILRNFIANALKFTESGVVRVTAEQRGERLRFAVEDTGIGIKPEDLERIFEEYWQVDAPTRRRYVGSGLGLPLSRRLASLLGGQVSVTSEPGKGSTFVTEVPLVCPRLPTDATERFGASAASEAPAAAPEPATHAGVGLRVLVIDDNEIARFLLVDILRDLDCAVEEAAGGEAGLEAARARLPEVAFVDLVMPDVDGFTVVRELAADPRTRAVPRVVYTSKVLSEEERAFLTPLTVAILAKESPSRAVALAQIAEVLASVERLPTPAVSPEVTAP